MPAAAKQKGTRTCVGCGEQSGKAAFMRIVRLSDGSVKYDPTGREAGRGAYVCSAACLDSALKTGKLKRALRTSISKEDVERLAADIASAATSAEM